MLVLGVFFFQIREQFDSLDCIIWNRSRRTSNVEFLALLAIRSGALTLAFLGASLGA